MPMEINMWVVGGRVRKVVQGSCIIQMEINSGVYCVLYLILPFLFSWHFPIFLLIFFSLVFSHYFFLIIFSGQWEDDKASGQGTLEYSNGDLYEGEWENDQRNGEDCVACSAILFNCFYDVSYLCLILFWTVNASNIILRISSFSCYDHIINILQHSIVTLSHIILLI